MYRPVKRHITFLLATTLCIILFIIAQSRRTTHSYRSNKSSVSYPTPAYDWKNRIEDFPVKNFTTLPLPPRRRLPRVQHRFGWFAGAAQKHRQDVVKAAFYRCWQAYREHAWMADELAPVSNGSKVHFAGWSATLVDALDTLWIMGLKAEFEEAVEAVMTIDFSLTAVPGSISLFETTIRYLGGLLAAYDLSGDPRLLVKAVELGHTLYGAFDTPNRMPLTSWDVRKAARANATAQAAGAGAILADIGSLTLEFTRLSQLTGDPRWYDAVDKIMQVFAAQQNMTRLPDSMYEYLLKTALLLGGSGFYEDMYTKAAATISSHLLFRPMTPDNADILLPGKASVPLIDSLNLPPIHTPAAEHLGCFLGGLFALGGRTLTNPSHITTGRKITAGCVWAYTHSPLGVGPEDWTMLPCPNLTTACTWNESAYHSAILARAPTQSFGDQSHLDHSLRANSIIAADRLPTGFTSIANRVYILRPEAIESVFILYRITGDPQLREDAWEMFLHIQNATMTATAHSAIADVTDEVSGGEKKDEMESFWLAETLKYFYLIFGQPGLVSLDEWVFNTEAHPLRRPKGRGWWW
ncbi:glycoside hydrolase family 47 protein [Baudoinia panamericana UAMH 10762]|uniref:alpha-1,2-Mannosidase n=1 Tax=Baudoinia panamericana (strain UAMH 10762) TaxID=717646 RepID=M2N7V5_BAUPA|nr:glycoside hydrolase family 47 protein [Baudoinia panamericana UAMH 10762]EMD00189.1 glycoside hydrolase family 47 protein [Baudoinia panamericana UAMH 10762]